MSNSLDLSAICQTLSQEYSVCDIADGLERLGVPQAGYLADIFPRTQGDSTTRFVAPISTIQFVPKNHHSGSAFDEGVHRDSNLPNDKHWTDVPPAGSIAVLQQPHDQICAVLGDILGTRLKVRGVKGVLVDGRIRDLVAIRDLCKDGTYTAWSKGVSTVTTSLEAKVWAVDVPLRIQGVEVRPGDLMCIDEAEKGAVVIPQGGMKELMEVLPKLKVADDARLWDVQKGVNVEESFKRHPK